MHTLDQSHISANSIINKQFNYEDQESDNL